VYLLFFLFDLALKVLFAMPVNAAVDSDPGGDAAPGAPDVTAAELRLSLGSGGYAPAIQLSARADIQVTGMVAHVHLEQSFRNDTDGWAEGEYLFPLPESAAVNRLEMVIGERVIVGEVREKQEARSLYERARVAGHKASLVEQRRPNLFSNRVANIAPGETVSVALDYVQRVDYRDGEFSLRFPMTVTPRYSPLGHTGAAEVWQLLGPEVATQSNPIQVIELTAEINLGLPLASVESPHHALALSRERERYQVRLAAGLVPMDRDFVLRWRPHPGSEPQAAVFHERIGAREYALLMVLPPSQPSQPGALPREVIFVIDTSGSMGGSSIAQARASLDFALGELKPADRFNIVEFNSGARRLFPRSVDANMHNLSRAGEFVRHLDAGGGTEMRSALELALPLPHPDGSGRVRQVVFITDGAVANEVELFREIERRLGGSRLFTVGIGSAPNSWFMRTAARVGRGDFTFIGDALEVQERMQRLFRRLGQTVMADFKVEWPVPVETYPAKLPDLYPGEPLVIAARSSDSLQGSQIAISGRSGDTPWTRNLLFAPPVSGMERAYTGIGVVWARASIENLMDQKILGGDEAAVRDAVLAVALEHQLLSPYTSFVALEQEPSRASEDALETLPVPKLRPAGQSPQPFAYPRTATSWRLQLLLGLGLLVCTCVFWRLPALQRP
jgi:Ca-activated chloride channel family protein